MMWNGDDNDKKSDDEAYNSQARKLGGGAKLVLLYGRRASKKDTVKRMRSITISAVIPSATLLRHF